MVSRISVLAIFLLVIACSNQNNFPVPISEKVDFKAVKLTSELPINNFSSNSKIEGFKELMKIKSQYQEKDVLFNLDDFKNLWAEIYKNTDTKSENNSDLQKWFEVTGLLFEITGKAGYAAELERLAFLGNIDVEKVESYVFTKNLDNLFVNIFTPSVIEYKHTTGGDVKIEMLTDYPKSGKIDLKFNMTERRYIEVNVRIPDWAEGATVTVKRVKYFAPPGSYCKIAKKWKEGDLVEIKFPKDKIPEYLKTPV